MFMRRVLLAVFFCFSVGAYAAPAFQEGKDYQLLPQPSLRPDPQRIQVREFFWYGCPHCYHLLPVLDAWARKKPAYVDLVLTPAALNPEWQIDAQAYYADEIRGVAGKLHDDMFNAIHRDQNIQLINNVAAIDRFYTAHGAGANFSALMNSMVVLGKVNAAAQLARQYQLEGVPSLVIDGKYLVDYHAGEPARMMQVVDYVIALEHHGH